MPTHITAPTVIEAAGNKPKIIKEYVGNVNNSEASMSVAHMLAPAGWVEPGQTPEFEETTLVLKGPSMLPFAVRLSRLIRCIAMKNDD